jgi:WD40 repeat protein
MGLAFSVDGRHLATSSYEQTRVWERWDGGKPRQVGRFEKSRVSPYGAFSQDGKNLTTFASGGEGANYACIWDLATGRELARVKHTSELKVSMFSPDGKYLLTGGQDYTRISLWHPDDLIHEACRRLAFDVGLSQWRSFRGDEKLMTSPCDDKR